MSENHDWTAAGGAPGQQPPPEQAYPPPAPAGQYAYQPPPYQQPYRQGYPAPPYTAVAPKNPGLALLISFFLPGVGSLYASKTNTGIVIIIGYIVSWLLVFVVIGIVGVVGFWIWGMIDAYHAAQAWNRARGIES
jgi:TM2 domain-containing membrane protein YozV